MERNIDAYNSLPPEIWCNVIRFVDQIADLIAIRRVCKSFSFLVKEENICNFFGHDINKDYFNFFKEVNVQKATDEEINECWEKRIGVTSKPDSSDYYVLKMLLNGNPGVGKTTFVDSFSSGKYALDYESYVAGDFRIRRLQHVDGVEVILQAWDPPDQQRFYKFMSSFYKNTDLIAFMFAIDDRTSFTNLDEWMRLCYENKSYIRENATFVLIGMKSDSYQRRQVSTIEARYLASLVHMKYYEISSINYETLEQAMQSITEDALRAKCAWLWRHEPVDSDLQYKAKRRCLVM